MRILFELMISFLQFRIKLLQVLIVILVKGFGGDGAQFSDLFNTLLNLLLEGVLLRGEFF